MTDCCELEAVAVNLARTVSAAHQDPVPNSDAAHLRLDRPSIMSTAPTAPSTSTSQPNFVSIFNAALESYKRKTEKDLASHPLLPSLQACESPEAVLTVLRDQVPALTQLQSCDDRHTKWVTPTVNVLYSFSGTIGQGVGLVNID